jgi:ATP-dependent DNA helicase RecG
VAVIHLQPPTVSQKITGAVTGEVRRLLLVSHGVMTRRQLRESLSLKSEENFRQLYLIPALLSGFIEMTIPDKPNSRLQKYRLTPKGVVLLQKKFSLP